MVQDTSIKFTEINFAVPSSITRAGKKAPDELSKAKNGGLGQQFMRPQNVCFLQHGQFYSDDKLRLNTQAVWKRRIKIAGGISDCFTCIPIP